MFHHYFFQGRILHHNTSAGIIISNQSLVLQSITRKSAGLYTCVGTNSEGDGASNPVVLNVKCNCEKLNIKSPFAIDTDKKKFSQRHLLVLILILCLFYSRQMLQYVNRISRLSMELRVRSRRKSFVMLTQIPIRYIISLYLCSMYYKLFK